VSRLGAALVHAFARVAILLSALAFEGGQNLRATAWALGAAAAFLVARVAGTLLRARREIELSHELVRRVLGGNLFESPLRGKQDVVIAGLYEQARLEAQVIPLAVADVALVGLVSVFALSRGEAVRLAAFLVGLGVGIGIVLALRRSAWRASIRAWEAREAHMRRVVDGLEGAAEIVSGAASDRYERRFVQTMRSARRASLAVAFDSVIVGRVPILAGVGLALVAVSALTGTAAPTRASEWAVLAAMLAPFAGLAAAAASVIETRGAVTALRALLRQPLRSTGVEAPSDVGSIELDGVDARYGEAPALHGVDLEVARGLTVLTGRNGSGKSTVLRILAGLVTPDAGTVTVGGVAAARVAWEDVRRRSASLAQRPYVPVNATVREYLTFLFDVGDDACQAALERTEAWHFLCEKVPASPLSTPMDELSAGERQRVAIARLLLRDADLYLLDEPDANLDRAGTERLCEILQELAARATVVVAAHTPALLGIADRVVELDGGRVFRDETKRATDARATQGA